MATATINPNADRATVEWMISDSRLDHYDHMNDGVGSGADSLYISAYVSGWTDSYEFEDAPADLGYVSQIKVRVRVKYGWNGTAAWYGYTVKVYTGDTFIGSDTESYTGGVSGVVNDHIFTGLNLDAEEIHALRINLYSAGNNWTFAAAILQLSGELAVLTYSRVQEAYVYALQADITYITWDEKAIGAVTTAEKTIPNVSASEKVVPTSSTTEKTVDTSTTSEKEIASSSTTEKDINT